MIMIKNFRKVLKIVVVFVISFLQGCNESSEEFQANEKHAWPVIVYASDFERSNSAGRIQGYTKNGFVNRTSLGTLHAFAVGRGLVTNPFFITPAANFQVGHEFTGIAQYFSADFNGDQMTDLLTRDQGGDFRMYYWNNAQKTYYGNLNGAIVLQGTNFTNYLVGDFTGDRIADLLVRDFNGVLFLYPWDTTLGFNNPVAGTQVGHSFNFTHFFVADWNGDGTSDLICRNSSGSLLFFPCRNSTFYGQGGGTVVGNSFQFQDYFVGEFTGDNFPDLVGRFSNGNMHMYPFLRNTFIGNGGGRVIATITHPHVFFGNWSQGTNFYDIVAVQTSGRADYFKYDIALRGVTEGTTGIANWSTYSNFLPGLY